MECVFAASSAGDLLVGMWAAVHVGHKVVYYNKLGPSAETQVPP